MSINDGYGYYGGREYDHYLVRRTLVSGQSTFHSILH
jgi:hypothetical protein